MLIVLQFPIADARPFLEDSTGRLDVPSWPIPKPKRDFVRNFGEVHARTRGISLPKVLSHDFYFAVAASALKYIDLNGCALPKISIQLRGAYRRLFCDGMGMTRVELGLNADSERKLSGDDLIALLNNCLCLPTKVRQYPHSSRTNLLQLQAAPLSRLYLYSSTRKNVVANVEEKYVSACEPILLFEYDEEKITPPMPSRCKVIDPNATGGVPLSYTKLFSNGQSIGIYLLGCVKDNRDDVRRLRLCLLRLHAQHEVLAQVLRWVSNGFIQYKPNSEAGDNIEEYLNKATREIFQQKKYGVRQSAIRDALSAYELVMSPGQKDVLFEVLEGVRRQIRVKLKRFTSQQQVGKQAIIVNVNGRMEGGTLNIMGKGPTVRVNYGKGNVFYGDAIAAGYIEDSFKAAGKTANGEVQDALERLTTNAANLIEKLDASEQQMVSRKLRALTEEAAASVPDKSFLKVTGEGLIDAAKTVAEMLGPITTAVKGVLSLFGIAI